MISLGHEAYANALRDPDSLVDVARPEDDVNWESISYVRDEAYESVTGSELPATGPFLPTEPAGEDWEEGDLPRIVPRLSAKYGP